MKTFKQLRENYRSNEPLYHIIPIDNVYGVIKSGKLIPRGSNGTGNFSYDSNLDRESRGRIHFTNDPDYWLGILSGQGKNSAILRISPEKISKYKFKPTIHASNRRNRFTDKELKDAYGGSFGGDLFTTNPVSVNNLDIYDPSEDAWVPLKSVSIHDIFDYINYV